MANINTAAIITAGGLGKRFDGTGDTLPKQFIPLSGKPVIAYSILSFESSKLINEIAIVVPENWVEYTKTEIVDKFDIKKVSKVISGGDERQDSVKIGLRSLSKIPSIVVVHDGVRPLVTIQTIDEVITQAEKTGGAIAAIPATDTIKKSAPEHTIKNTLRRENIWFAQTPQAFRYEILKEAFEKASEDGYLGTDEAELVERLGKEVKLVKSSKYNIKITTPEDLELGEIFLASSLHRNKGN
ncbi:MAG: 2-C-methyl-D-erythritol 4-phosphate cytidylyltransferase [Thermodesulfobacteriota bacterium]|nr:MAG: 2-C-methyl-D-erythritol 4-phosphate cytidylyltransferase [Thermodesulfobacteriota bacterium]